MFNKLEARVLSEYKRSRAAPSLKMEKRFGLGFERTMVES